MTPALEAAVCLIASGILRRLGLAGGASSGEVSRRLDVARSYAYEQRDRLAAFLERGLGEPADDPGREATRKLRLQGITLAVLEYRVTHPGCWVEGGRTVYARGVRALVLSLAEQYRDVEQADFAAACRIPLPTFKAWWAEHSASLARKESPLPVPPSTAAPPDAAPPDAAAPPDEGASAGFTLEMLRIIREYGSWDGTLEAFVAHLRDDLGLRYGRERVTQLLHLAAARKLLRKPPPPRPVRGSTFRPPPGVQWTSDGKEVELVVGGQTFVVTWQPMIDVGSAATVGDAVRPTEDSAGVIAALGEGVATTGAPPRVLLLDNKAPNRSEALREALPDETMLMHATLGRPQNKAVIEGGFGLFAHDLGRVIAVVETSTPEAIALSVAEAVTRAYATGRNHRPRRADGKSRYDLFRDGDRSPEKVAAAVEILRRMKERIDTRDAREIARRDPQVQALLDDLCARFGFTDDGDVLDGLRTFPLETVESAAAIYAARQTAGTLPLHAGLRYFGGIVRNVQYDRELRAFEEELVKLLESRGQILADYLHRQAARFASLDLAPHLGAVVDQLLTVPVPTAQSFWRRCLATVAATVPTPLRAPLRRWLCQRVRRCFAATKQLRRNLTDDLIRMLTPEPPPPLLS
jgi:hypothetical protein